MFCKQCGNELVGTELYCDICGNPVQAVRTRDEVQEPRVHSDLSGSCTADVGFGKYQSFEYARTNVNSDMAQVALDCYESLGYELTGQRTAAPGKHTTLSFRRSRKVRGKAQLSKIQRAMDDEIDLIEAMEEEKAKKATAQAVTIGVISALILGVGMCCTMVWTNLMIPGIMIGLVGIAGCVYAYLRYRKVYAKETMRLDPQIEATYDRLATHCEEAQAVLQAQAV